MNFQIVQFNVFHKNQILNDMYIISPMFKVYLNNEYKDKLINTMPMTNFLKKILKILCIIIDNNNLYNIRQIELICLLNYIKNHKYNNFSKSIITFFIDVILLNKDYEEYIKTYYSYTELERFKDINKCQILFNCFDITDIKVVEYDKIDYIITVCPRIFIKLLNNDILHHNELIVRNLMDKMLFYNYSVFYINITHDYLLSIYNKLKGCVNYKKINKVILELHNKLFKNIILDSTKYNSEEYFKTLYKYNIVINNRIEYRVINYLNGIIFRETDILYMGKIKYLLYLLKNYEFHQLQNYYNTFDYSLLDMIFIRSQDNNNLLHNILNDLFDVLKNVKDKKLWLFLKKLLPNYRLRILEHKLFIISIINGTKITYDIKFYLLLKRIKEHISNNIEILKYLESGITSLLFNLNVSIELIEFYKLFNELYIIDNDKLIFQFNSMYKYEDSYICTNINDKPKLLEIKSELEANSIYVLYFIYIDALYNQNNIDNILKLTELDIDENIVFYRLYNIEIFNKEELMIDDNEVCYLCLYKIKSELENIPILKSTCNHYICEGCSKDFFNINPDLYIRNENVSCGICRNIYNFRSCKVYI